MQKESSFTYPCSGKHYPIQGHFSCNSNFVAYQLKCPCGLCYVGETTQTIKVRRSQSKSTICIKREELPIHAHFIQAKHEIHQLNFKVIDWVPTLRCGGDRVKYLQENEMRWILRNSTSKRTEYRPCTCLTQMSNEKKIMGTMVKNRGAVKCAKKHNYQGKRKVHTYSARPNNKNIILLIHTISTI